MGYQSAVMPSTLVTARRATARSYVRASPMTPTDRTGSRTRKRLPYLVVHAGCANLVDKNLVGFPQEIEPVLRNVAENANARAPAPETGAGRSALPETPSSLPSAPDFVLK